MSFSSALKSFSDYTSNTNTIKNPLDTIFPNTREKVTGEQPPVIVQEPIVKKIEDIRDNVKNQIADIKAKTTPIIFFGVIALVLYLLSKND